MPGPPTDLRIDDLTVEFSKGDYTVRPLDHLTRHRRSGNAGAAARSVRVREDDAAVVPGGDPQTDVGLDHVRRRRDHGVDRP